jgi:FAD:protein FMN transferase
MHPASLTSRVAALSFMALACLSACGDRAAETRPASTDPEPKAPAEAAPATATPAPAAPAAATPSEPAAAPLLSVKRSRNMMGTVIQMTSIGLPEESAGPALEAALSEMQRLEGLLSEWQPDSDVSRVNQAAGKQPVKVGPEMLENVEVGLEVSRWSDGAFDLSWAALRGSYLFRPGEERVPSDAELKQRLALVGYKDILVDRKAQTVFLKRAGMQLGLGGIAKGYALERAARLLAERGVANYMIFGGGQVLVNGMKGDRAWRVGVQHPRMNDYFAFIEATSGTIATSGDYEHAFVRDGVHWHHIIDLKTGRPVQHTTSVTVVSESAFYADAIDTALFIMGPEKALAKLPSAPGPKAELLLVDKDLRVYESPGMRARLIMRMPLTDDKLPPPP